MSLNTLAPSNELMNVEALALLFHIMSFPTFPDPFQSQELPHLPQEATDIPSDTENEGRMLSGVLTKTESDTGAETHICASWWM